jgi:thiol-disulfide isomerase/thioredoxin
MVLCVVSIFIVAAIYVWRTYISGRVSPSYVPNKEFVEDGQSGETTSGEADLYFFYTVWCPHCSKAKPEWSKFKEAIGDSKIKGTRINFIEVDCDQDTATAERFKVDAYPTIKLVHNDRVIEYDAKPELETLRQFLNVSL